MTVPLAIQLYLIRHAPTTAPPGSLAGSSDLPLSGEGVARLASVSKKLTGVDSWFCSPMLRTRQTLEIIEQKGCTIDGVRYDDRLREMDFGRWELKTFADIAALEPDRVNDMENYLDFVFPQGERVADFIDRVQEMLQLFSASNNDRIAVVTHGGIIRTMICLALNICPSNYLLFTVDYASLSILEMYSRGGVLRGLNL